MITADVKNKPKHFRSQQKQEQMLHMISPYRKQTGQGVILMGVGLVVWYILKSHGLVHYDILPTLYHCTA